MTPVDITLEQDVSKVSIRSLTLAKMERKVMSLKKKSHYKSVSSR